MNLLTLRFSVIYVVIDEYFLALKDIDGILVIFVFIWAQVAIQLINRNFITIIGIIV